MSNDQYHNFLAYLKLHILQSYSPTDTLTCDKETFEFFKKTHRLQALQPKTQNLTPPAPLIPKWSEPKKTPLKKEPEKEKRIESQPKQQEVAPKSPKLVHTNNSNALLALCKKPAKAEPLLLQDVEQKVNGMQKEPIASLKNNYPWKNTYPQCLIISLFTTGSSEEAFLQKMEEAITFHRALRAKLYQAHACPQAFVHTYATTDILQTIFIAYPSKEKADEWFAEFHVLEENSEDMGLIKCRYRLFGVPIFELEFIQAPTQQQKAHLWKTLLKM